MVSLSKRKLMISTCPMSQTFHFSFIKKGMKNRTSQYDLRNCPSREKNHLNTPLDTRSESHPSNSIPLSADSYAAKTL